LSTLEKNPDAQTISGSLEIFMLPDNYHPPFQVLSHMKESMVARITLEALVKMRQYFHLLKSKEQTSILLIAS
jgi:hypothetical protein